MEKLEVKGINNRVLEDCKGWFKSYKYEPYAEFDEETENVEVLVGNAKARNLTE